MTSILVIIAHPDDEVFASGTICLCASRGFRIDLISITNGESGDDSLLVLSPKLTLDEVRRRELLLSSVALGVGSVSFLNQPDSTTPRSPVHGTWNETEVVASIVSKIAGLNPDLIITHGPLGGYGHDAHKLTHRCVMKAVTETSFNGSVFSFCGRVPNAFFSWHMDAPSAVVVDAQEFFTQRCAALAYHQTQVSYFVQPYFPRTARKVASMLFGYSFSWLEEGRRRIPIGTPQRFFMLYPKEGLSLQKPPTSDRSHFFRQHFDDDKRVKINW